MVNRLGFLILFGLTSYYGMAQTAPDSVDTEFDEVRGMVSLYRFMLNTIGSSQATTSEKETIINNSYLKLFRDPEVQIEDDLSTDRITVLNKSVQGYLRDVDFFFKEASFEFDDLDVSRDTSEAGEIFYRVKYTSTLEVVDLDDSVLTDTQDRYIEINRFGDQGLKIVSIYSQVMEPIDELRQWWETMDLSWKMLFLGYIKQDSITDEGLISLTEIDSLDLSGLFQIEHIDPLIQLRNLRYLNLHETGIRDITPLRYAVRLQSLNLSYSLIADVSVVSYLRFLEHLNLEGCSMLQPGFLGLMPSLAVLNLSHTGLIDFSGLNQLTRLVELDVSNTTFDHLDGLSALVELKQLDASNTSISSWPKDLVLRKLEKMDLSGNSISDISFVSSLTSLVILDISETSVADLKSMPGHPSLSKVNADFTKVSDAQARDVMSQQPGLVILTETDQLVSWWNDLSEDWRSLFSKAAGHSEMPTLEELVLMRQLDSIDISGLSISDASPLTSLKQLSYLNISGTGINSLYFLQSLPQLKYLDCSNTQIVDLVGIQYAKELEAININQTAVQSPGLLSVLTSLKRIDADQTDIPQAVWEEYLLKHQNQQVLYKSEELIKWWDNLDGSIKRELSRYLGEYSSENLHDLVRRRVLSIEKIGLSYFHQLEEFTLLNKLIVKKAEGDYLPDLTSFSYLDSLIWQECPLASISAVKSLPKLQYLSVAKTAIEDLSELQSHPGLTSLDCSSTQVKSIKSLRSLQQLVYLNISNTRVWQLNWLYDIRGMKTLECFNSKVSSKKVEQFREVFPDCEIIYY